MDEGRNKLINENHIIDSFPYPIAKLYKEMLEEEDFRFKFLTSIKVFATVLKYLSIICISDYLSRQKSESVNNVLYPSLKKPKLGEWKLFLQTIIGHYKNKNYSFPLVEMKNIFKKNTHLINYFLQVRNFYVHPGIILPCEEAKIAYEEMLPKLNAFLNSFEFLVNYTLKGQNLVNNEESKLMGYIIDPKDGPFNIFVEIASGERLDITPFILISVDHLISNVLIYEHNKKPKEVVYVLGNKFKVIQEINDPYKKILALQKLFSEFKNISELESEKQRELVRNEIVKNYLRQEMNISALRKLSQVFSEKVIEAYRKWGAFDAATYVPRKNIERSYYELLNGSASILVLVSDSGVGKSTELCRFYIKNSKTDVIWFLSGRTIQSNSFLEEVEEYIFGDESSSQTLSEKLALFNDSRIKEKFIILFDGLNETKNPIDIFSQIQNFVSNNSYSWLKIIITCRSFMWNNIEHSRLLINKKLFLSLDEDSVALKLEHFNEEELQTALKKYSIAYKSTLPTQWNEDGCKVERLLKNPIIIRFLFEVYKGTQIPSRIEFEKIMTEFTNKKIRERDLSFLQNQLMAYCYLEQTDIIDSKKITDRLKANQEAIPYKELDELIFGEQISEIDQVWLCQEKGCFYSNHPIFIDDNLSNSEILDQSSILDEDIQKICPHDKSTLKLVNVDNRSVYSRMLSENILYDKELDDRIIIRFVFDRYFEYLMKEYIYNNLLNGKYDSIIIEELITKSTECAIFAAPLKNIIKNFALIGELNPIYQVSTKNSFTTYQILRDLFEDLAVTNFDLYKKILDETVKRSTFNFNIRRAGIHSLLINPELVVDRKEDIIDLVLLLCIEKSDKLFDDIGEYLVNLKLNGVDLFTPLIIKIGDLLFVNLEIGKALRFIYHWKKFKKVLSQTTLLVNISLYGLGHFFSDVNIRTSIIDLGKKILKTIFKHPILKIAQLPLSIYFSRKLIKIYKGKGPLPCNYWEMLFQLDNNREDFYRVGDYFNFEKLNLFDMTYEEFKNKVHSENGLITWYMLSILKIHYYNYPEKGKAISYLSKLFKEGSSFDKYVAGNVIANLYLKQDYQTNEIEIAMDELCESFLLDPSQIYIHPSPLNNSKSGIRAEKYNQNLVKKTCEEKLLPIKNWISISENKIHRWYLNPNVFHVALYFFDREKHDNFSFVIKILEDNRQRDLLCFYEREDENKKITISVIIRAMISGVEHGNLREILNTIDILIDKYVINKIDSSNVDIYKKSIIALLKSIKEYHQNEVLIYIERFDILNSELCFLAEVKNQVIEKEELFSKSIYLNNIYQSIFENSPEIGIEFGKLTQKVFFAKNVEELFMIYTKGFLSWLKSIQ